MMRRSWPRFLSTSWPHRLALVVLWLAVMAGPPGCRCGEDPPDPQSAPVGIAGLPEQYPTQATGAAQALAGHLPAETDAALFVSSYAALVELTDRVRAWGIVDASQLDGIFASLERYHGINPGKAQSWRDNGFALDAPLVIGRLDGNWFAITTVEDPARFEAFLDGFINQEFGRPRNATSEHKGVALREIRVLKRDLMTLAWRGNTVFLAAGERLRPEAGPSADAVRRLLDTQQSGSLSVQDEFTAMLARLGEAGPLFVYTSEGRLALDLLAPFAAASETLAKRLEKLVGEELRAFGLVARAGEDALVVESFASLPAESLADTLELVTPPGAPERLAALVGSEPRGLLRATFAPRAAEATVLSFFDPKAAEAWKKLKGQLVVPFVVNFPEDVLYNLSGQLVVALYEIDEDALVPSDDLLALLRDGARGAVFLPMRDKGVANSFFSKVNALKDLVSGMLPKGQVTFGDREGVMVVTLNARGGVPLAHVLYHDGVLAAASADEATVSRVVARLKSDATAPAAVGTAHAALLEAGAVWGVSLDMREVVQLLSARYDAVQTQIGRFLAPLARVGLRVGFEAEGVGLALTIEMRPSGSAEDGEVPSAQAVSP